MPPRLFRQTSSPRELQRQRRRAGQHEAAFAEAERLVASTPADRRAWVRLAHAALSLQKIPDADRALTHLIELSISRGKTRDAVRALLRRASFGAGGEPKALAQQAARLAELAGDRTGCFLARQVLAVLSVQRGDPTAAQETLHGYLQAAIEAGREASALATMSQLAIGEGKGAGIAARLLGARALARGEHEIAARWLLESLRRLPGDHASEEQLMRLIFERGLWGELAVHYRLQADRSNGPARALALERLAELLEDEFNNQQGARETYAEAVIAGSGAGALRELVRLGALRGDLRDAVALLANHFGARREETLTALEQLSQTDLPPAARVHLLEAAAKFARDVLGDPARAEALQARTSAARVRA